MGFKHKLSDCPRSIFLQFSFIQYCWLKGNKHNTSSSHRSIASGGSARGSALTLLSCTSFLVWRIHQYQSQNSKANPLAVPLGNPPKRIEQLLLLIKSDWRFRKITITIEILREIKSQPFIWSVPVDLRWVHHECLYAYLKHSIHILSEFHWILLYLYPCSSPLSITRPESTLCTAMMGTFPKWPLQRW